MHSKMVDCKLIRTQWSMARKADPLRKAEGTYRWRCARRVAEVSRRIDSNTSLDSFPSQTAIRNCAKAETSAGRESSNGKIRQVVFQGLGEDVKKDVLNLIIRIGKRVFGGLVEVAKQAVNV